MVKYKKIQNETTHKRKADTHTHTKKEKLVQAAERNSLFRAWFIPSPPPLPIARAIPLRFVPVLEVPLSRWSGRLKHCHLLDENGYLPASILKQAADHKIGRAPTPPFAGHGEREEKRQQRSAAAPPGPHLAAAAEGISGIPSSRNRERVLGKGKQKGCGMSSRSLASLGPGCGGATRAPGCRPGLKRCPAPNVIHTGQRQQQPHTWRNWG